jgi:hypothetical protein
MRFLENSPDIPDELIRAVSAGEVMFLCGAGVSFAAGLPTFKDLTKQVYVTLGEDLKYEHAEITAFNQNEFDRALRSLEKRTNLPGYGFIGSHGRHGTVTASIRCGFVAPPLYLAAISRPAGQSQDHDHELRHPIRTGGGAIRHPVDEPRRESPAACRGTGRKLEKRGAATEYRVIQ